MKIFVLIVMFFVVGAGAFDVGRQTGAKSVKRRLVDIDKICFLDVCIGHASAEDMAFRIQNILVH